jgi:hypothetical protein
LVIPEQSGDGFILSLTDRFKALAVQPFHRSTFSEPNSVSEQALSQQFPLPLIEGVMAYSLNTLLKSSLAYWLPRSLWKISLLF